MIEIQFTMTSENKKILIVQKCIVGDLNKNIFSFVIPFLDEITS